MALRDGLAGYAQLYDDASNSIVHSLIGADGSFPGELTSDHAGISFTSKLIGSLYFDGGFNYVSLPFGARLRNGESNSMSIFAWVQRALSGERHDFITWKIASSGDDLGCYVDTDNKLKAFLQINSSLIGTPASTGTVSSGIPHLLGLTYNGSNSWKLWIDGANDGSIVGGGTLANHGTDTIFLGSNHDGSFSPLSAFNLNGYMSNFMVWTRDLSSAEIAELYNGGIGRSFQMIMDRPLVRASRVAMLWR